MANIKVKMIRRQDAEAVVDLTKRREWHIDLVPVVTAVLKGTGAKTLTNRVMAAGETAIQGQAVYQDTATDMNLAQSDAAATAELAGVTLNAASPGQPVDVLYEGNYNPGVAVVPGTMYVLSAAAAGGIAPIDDLVSTNLSRALGFATTTSNIYVQINNNGGIVP